MTDYKNLKLIASSSPHIRSNEDTRSIMLDVIIALLPALACDTILQTLDLLFSVCELADPHTRNFVLALGTVDFTDDQVLRNVYQTTGQVTGVGGTKRGIGHTFSCSMCGHEVFQYLKTFTEV